MRFLVLFLLPFYSFSHTSICEIGYHHEMKFHSDLYNYYMKKMSKSIFHKDYWKRYAEQESKRIHFLLAEYQGKEKCEC